MMTDILAQEQSTKSLELYTRGPRRKLRKVNGVELGAGIYLPEESCGEAEGGVFPSLRRKLSRL